MKLTFLNCCPGCLCLFASVSLYFCPFLSLTYCPSVVSHLPRASNNNYNLTLYQSIYGKSFAWPQPSHRVRHTGSTSLILAVSCSRTFQKHDVCNKSSLTPAPVLFVVTAATWCPSLWTPDTDICLFVYPSFSDRGRHMWVL